MACALQFSEDMVRILASFTVVLVTTGGAASADPGAGELRAQYRANIVQVARVLSAAEATPPPELGAFARPVPMEIRTAPGDNADGARSMGCVLLRDGSDRVTPSQCLSCHRGTAHVVAGHPVEVDYESARARVGVLSRLRPTGEAVRRGAFLPEGKVRCVSCHDGRSQFRYRLALPEGAEIRPAVRPGDPRTYESPEASVTVIRVAASGRAAASAESQEAAVKPLCLTCHPMD